MLISLLFAVYTMGIARKIPIKNVMESCTITISHIGMMLLIVGSISIAGLGFILLLSLVV